MDLSIASIWWIATGIAVAAELVTGSFYLLMVAFGLAAGAGAAMLGASGTVQVLAAALLGSGTTALWHRRRARLPSAAPAREDRGVNLDIGERVHVTAWTPDRTARVQYRGSDWTARLAPGAEPVAGEHRVVAVEGNWLVLGGARPRAADPVDPADPADPNSSAAPPSSH